MSTDEILNQGRIHFLTHNLAQLNITYPVFPTRKKKKKRKSFYISRLPNTVRKRFMILGGEILGGEKILFSLDYCSWFDFVNHFLFGKTEVVRFQKRIKG